MKLTAIILLAASLHVSAGGYGQRVTLQVKDAAIRSVFAEIKRQTGYLFFYTDTDLQTVKSITVRVKDASLTDVLDACFRDQPLTYSIIGNNIVIRQRTAPPLREVESNDPPVPIDVHGHVVNDKGEPAAGITMTVKGSNRATSTDANGDFVLNGIDSRATLVLSGVDIETYEIKVNGKTMVNIIVRQKLTQLNEVVVNKGYYSTTKTLNTGNVSTVKGEELAKSPVGDPMMALEGRVPGLYIAQTSGVPGSALTVKLRGQNSIANGNNPLYIVDGVPFTSTTLVLGLEGGAAGSVSPFASIKMNDIEQIEVLKDADATAIYGSRGANGVILITTKKGKAGKSKVNLDVNTGAGKVGRKMKLLNTAQYLEVRQQALTNDGVSVSSTDYDLNGQWGDIRRYTDWQKIFIGGTAKITDAAVSVSGGTAQTQYLFGGGYRKETTVFPGDVYNVKASAHINVNHESDNRRFHSNISVSYVNDNNKMPSADFTSNIMYAPNAPELYKADGTYNWQNSTWDNPMWYSTQTSSNITDNLTGALNFGYELVKGLSITARMGYNDIKFQGSQLATFQGYNPDIVIVPSYRSNIYSDNHIRSWIIEPAINYSRQLGKGKLEALAGATVQQNDQLGLYQKATGFASDALVTNIPAASTNRLVSFVDTRYRYDAFYARLGYNYQDKYLLNLTGRRDASSRFGPGKQFANLGSAGAAWLFSRETFFGKSAPFLSFGKLRASYGITGNDQLGDYKYLSTYSTYAYTYQGTSGLQPTQLTNPEYGWETVKKLEAALDLGFFKDRLLLTVSWYRNRTGNQLVGYALPDITGFSSVQANLPAVIQNTGTEFEFTSGNVRNKNFSWTTSFNISIPRNKLVSYPNLAGSSYATKYVIGQPLFISFLYHYTGIDKTTNLYTFEDVNKDGQISYTQDRKPSFTGQDFFGGINNSFSFKGWQLDIFVQFVKQTAVRFGTLSPGIFRADLANQPQFVLSGGYGGAGPKQYTTSYGTAMYQSFSLFNGSDGNIGDASFVRLKNISLSWNLPEKYRQALKLQQARLYVHCQNLLTITKYIGMDPENAQTFPSHLPPLKMVTAGIQLAL